MPAPTAPPPTRSPKKSRRGERGYIDFGGLAEVFRPASRARAKADDVIGEQGLERGLRAAGRATLGALRARGEQPGFGNAVAGKTADLADAIVRNAFNPEHGRPDELKPVFRRLKADAADVTDIVLPEWEAKANAVVDSELPPPPKNATKAQRAAYQAQREKFMAEVMDEYVGQTQPGADPHAVAFARAYGDQLFGELDRVLGQKLVEQDWITQEQYDAHKGRYLPFLYPDNIGHYVDAGAAHGAALASDPLRAPSKAAARTKSRIPFEQWSYADRIKYGLLRDPIEAYKVGVIHARQLIATREMQEAIAKSHYVSDTPRDGWKAIDSTYTRDGKPGVNEKKYGPLAGKHVDPRVWDDVNDMVNGFRELEGNSRFLRMLSMTNRQLALAKVGLNPKGFAADVVSNFAAHELGGVPMVEMPAMLAEAARDLRGDRKWLKEAIREGDGLGRSMFEDAARKGELMDAVAEQVGTDNLKTGWGRAASWAVHVYDGAAAAGAKTYHAKAWLDSRLALAHYIYKRKVLKMDPQRAARDARDAAVRNEAPKWVRFASRYTHPFATWFHGYSMHALTSAVRRPLSTAKMLVMFPLLDAAIGAGGDTREKRMDRRQNAGLSPVEQRFGVNLTDDVALSPSRILPPPNPLEWPGITAPFFTESVAQVNNRDVRTGREIVPVGVDPWSADGVAARAAHLSDIPTPAAFTPIRNVNDAIQGREFRGRVRSVPGALMYSLAPGVTPIDNQQYSSGVFKGRQKQIKTDLMRESLTTTNAKDREEAKRRYKERMLNIRSQR